MEEIAFPRGSIKFLPGEPGDKDKNRRKDEDLFKSVDATKRKKKRRSKSGTRDEPPNKKEKTGFYVDTNADVIEPLLEKILTQGMLILGCIQRIKKYEIWINLPCSLMGIVPIMDISDSYIAMLKKFAESESGADPILKPPAPLETLFSIGSYVVCKVKEISMAGKPRIALTLNPKELHDNLTQHVLYHGMVLTAAVTSVEDHGYVMDVGISGLTAFLKHNKCLGRNTKKGQKLFVGQLLLCSIDMPDTDFKTKVVRSLDLNANPNTVSKSQCNDINLRAMLPGTKVFASISKVMKSGVILRVASNKGIVLRQHLMDPFQTLEMLEVQENVTGRILYVHPITKSLYVCLQKHVVSLFPKELFGGLRYGDIVEEAEVVEVVKGSVIFRLTKGVKGIAPPSKLPVKKREIAEAFPVGSIHRCMVRRLRSMDNVVMVSLKHDDISNVVLHFEDVRPGDIVQCNIVDHQALGIGVRIRGGIRGFIPNSLIADEPVNNLKKSFKLNTKLSCRVLKVSKKNLLILTSRASLVNSTLPIIAQYSDARPNMVVEGCIHNICHRGLAVSFYNSVYGFVSVKDVDVKSSLDATFKVGQLVKCTVIDSIPKIRRICLTMKKIGEVGSCQQAENFPTGKIVSCKVSRVSPTGMDVELLPSGIPAFLPVLHLSDHLSNCPLLLQTYAPDDIIDKVLCFSNATQPIVTMKPIFIEWVEKEKAISSIDNFKVGMLAPLVVNNQARYGVFVNLLYDMTALIPNRFLPNVSDVNESGLKPQQSLIGEVTKVYEADGKIEFNTIPINSLAVQLERRIDHLTVFLNEQKRVREHFLQRGKGKINILASQSVGSVVDFTIEMVSSHGAIGVIGTGIQAIVTKEHLCAKHVEVGQTVKAVVLAQDFLDCCLDLVIDDLVVNAVISSHPKSTTTPIPISNVTAACKGVIVMVKDDYILALIRHQGIQRIAFLPTKKHFNHVPNVTNLPKYRDECFIILKSVFDNGYLGILSTDGNAKMRRRIPASNSQDPQSSSVPISFVPLTNKKVAKSGKGQLRLKKKPGKNKSQNTKKKNLREKLKTLPVTKEVTDT